MSDYLQSLKTEFEKNSDPQIASEQAAYMRHHFEFYGLKTDTRREIQKPFLNKQHLPHKSELPTLIKSLWQKPQREYHYFAQELAFLYLKQVEQKDIALFEYMVRHQSWWDTVDFISTKLMGNYFKAFPKQRQKYVSKWIASDNIWLQRSALLFQLKYKHDLDTELLSTTIIALNGSKEFFINKAIGWVLREYSKTNPDWVMDFVNTTELSPLSKKEALRRI